MSRMRRASAERERALRQAAEDANRVKATFLATMSHELRTPLNAILGYTDLLEAEVAGSLTDGQKSQLQRIHLASRHLLTMIEEILSFSRIEAGREEVHLETIDVAELAVETCRLVEPLAVQKALTFDYDGPTERLFIKSDGGKVRQILLNLLSNAIKFTERGGVSVRVSDEGQEVSVEVRDTGVGIAPDQLDRIFEPFRQATSAGPRRHGGTGLGLTVSRELARLLGGDISVASAPQHGSTFTFRVPAGER
jgi:signal transduction histidine kinase